MTEQFKTIFFVSNDITKISVSCSCDIEYRSETINTLTIMMEEHCTAVVRCELMK